MILSRKYLPGYVALLGLVMVCAAVFMTYEPEEPSGERLSISLSKEYLTHMDVRRWTRDLIEITYPESLLVSDSDIIKVKWTPSGPGYFESVFDFSTGGHNENYNSEEVELKRFLQLRGAAFDISPHNPHEAKLKGWGSSATWSWSVAPKKEGTHKLLLDLTDLDIRLYDGMDNSATIRRNNGEAEPIAAPGLDSVTLQIHVLTKEGFTLRSYLIFRYTLLALGFILMYPAVSALVKDRLNMKKHKKL